jgi:UDP-glucose 4-epimerase
MTTPTSASTGTPSILVTGGAGFIGSHAVLRLLADGHRVLVVDNLYRGHQGAINALKQTLPPSKADHLTFAKLDLCDSHALTELAISHNVKSILHFAALTYVGESVTMPLEYWRANILATHSLLSAAHAAGVTKFVLSSTAATYGEPPVDQVPIRETTIQNPINPYGASKLASERLIRDYVDAQAIAKRPFAAAFLRYFNVAGSDPMTRIGEHHEPETHLIPIILQCVLGLRPKHNNTLSIFGTDYPTPDGTCLRDYVHVSDLVDAHLRVLDALNPGDIRAYNLGIGKPFSVKQVVDAVERVTGHKVQTTLAPRRAGDPAKLYADPSKVMRELGWQPTYPSLDDMIAHAWKWMKANPAGYRQS